MSEPKEEYGFLRTLLYLHSLGMVFVQSYWSQITPTPARADWSIWPLGSQFIAWSAAYQTFYANLKWDVGTRVSWSWAVGPNHESEWKRKLVSFAVCLFPSGPDCSGWNWMGDGEGNRIWNRKKVVELALHPRVTVILPGNLGET